jgi:hypothetical protein
MNLDMVGGTEVQYLIGRNPSREPLYCRAMFDAVGDVFEISQASWPRVTGARCKTRRLFNHIFYYNQKKVDRCPEDNLPLDGKPDCSLLKDIGM